MASTRQTATILSPGCRVDFAFPFYGTFLGSSHSQSFGGSGLMAAAVIHGTLRSAPDYVIRCMLFAFRIQDKHFLLGVLWKVLLDNCLAANLCSLRSPIIREPQRKDKGFHEIKSSRFELATARAAVEEILPMKRRLQLGQL